MKRADIRSLVLPHLNNVSGPDSQDWYTAICPYHDDHHPSLRIRHKGFICMACREKGNFRKLATRLGL